MCSIKTASCRFTNRRLTRLCSIRRARTNKRSRAFLVLGFGGSGEDLKKSFDVTYQGEETVDGVATAKLQLVPKSDKVRSNFQKIILWIDLERGISVQQKLMQSEGDYRRGQILCDQDAGEDRE